SSLAAADVKIDGLPVMIRIWPNGRWRWEVKVGELRTSVGLGLKWLEDDDE
ncbi:hypothetical protein Tco_0068745, partial [Tanacetum coccineum]